MSEHVHCGALNFTLKLGSPHLAHLLGPLRENKVRSRGKSQSPREPEAQGEGCTCSRFQPRRSPWNLEASVGEIRNCSGCRACASARSSAVRRGQELLGRPAGTSWAWQDYGGFFLRFGQRSLSRAHTTMNKDNRSKPRALDAKEYSSRVSQAHAVA